MEAFWDKSMVVIYRSALQSANPMCQSFGKDLNSPIQKATAYGEIKVAQWGCFHRCIYKTGKIDRNLSRQNVVTESVGETESQASMHAGHVTSHCRLSRHSAWKCHPHRTQSWPEGTGIEHQREYLQNIMVLFRRRVGRIIHAQVSDSRQNSHVRVLRRDNMISFLFAGDMGASKRSPAID